MQRDFWTERWTEGQTGWHNDMVHPGLQAHSALFADGPVFVPLCGASLDVAWLGRRGPVVGVEFSEVAAERLFDEAGLSPERATVGGHERWQAGPITLFVGDFFTLTPEQTGPLTGVWDRAAMIAIDPRRRDEYAARLRILAPGGTLLLNALVYDQSLHDGPPWALPAEEVRQRFAGAEALDEADVLSDRWRERGHRFMRAELHRIAL